LSRYETLFNALDWRRKLSARQRPVVRGPPVSPFLPVWLAALAFVASAASARAESPCPDGGREHESAAPADSSGFVVMERPYKLGDRPRADGAVEASVADESIARWNVGGSANPACASNRAGFHPAPRVKVDTVVRSGRMPPRSTAKGVLSELGILAQARNRGYWAFRLCFESGLRHDVSLTGKTRVRIVIARDGHVSSSRMNGTELHDSEVATCIATRARALRFTPAPRRRAEVDVTVDLAPGDAPLPDGVPGRLAMPPDPGPGKLDARAVETVLAGKLPNINKCYTEGRARDPALWGRLALRFDADARGAVQSVVEHDSRFPDSKVVGCILSALGGTALGTIPGGPLRFVWGIRLGTPPSPEVAGNQLSSNLRKSSVADSASPQVRLAQ
jgi:hypothetical protein